MKRLAFTTIFLVASLPSLLATSRTATIQEIEHLFNLAISNRPQKIWIIAEVTLREQAWSAAQVVAELEQQNKIMKETDRLLNSSQKAELLMVRSNAIAKSNSGLKHLRITEWYSGNKYRLDLTDDSDVQEPNWRTNSIEYKHTYVNIHDDAFSPYQSYSVNHALRDVLLTKNSDARWAPFDLWNALGLVEEVTIPVLLALVDLRSVDYRKRGVEWDMSQLKLDFSKAQRISEGLDPNWRLELSAQELDGVPVTRYKLNGQYPELDHANPGALPEMCRIEATYWIAWKSNRSVCVQAFLTNFTHHSSFYSKGEQFDLLGHPMKWKMSTIRKGHLIKELDVIFKQIDANATFADAEVFAPLFSKGYTVSDITSGRAVVLQNPHFKNGTGAAPHGGAKKRTWTLAALAFAVILPAVYAFWTRQSVPRKGAFER